MSSPHRVNRLVRATSTTAAAVLISSATGLAWSGTANAAAPTVFDLAVQAIALESTATDPNIPTGVPFTVGSYGASSRLSSLGDSAADAGAPYSPFLYSVPAFGNGTTSSTLGVGFPELPNFPGYVAAKDPITPLAKQTAGGYELTASAEPGRSVGMVSMGAQAATSEENNFFARAASVTDEDSVLSQGIAGVHALTLGGIVDIFDVSSRASLTLDSSGRVVPSTTTNLGTIEIAGLTSGLTGDGLVTAGNAPSPIDVSALDAINEALRPSGITLTYLPANYTYADGSTSSGDNPDAKKRVVGLSSGALQIVIASTTDRGSSSETLTIGRISVGAQAAGSSALGPQTGAEAAAGGATHGLPGLAATVAGSRGILPSVDAAALPGSVPGVAGALPTAPVSTAMGSVPVSQTFVPAASAELINQGSTSMESFYLTVAVASALALVASQVVRVLAARTR